MRCRVWRVEESSVGTAPMDIKTQVVGFRRHSEIVFQREREGFHRRRRERKIYRKMRGVLGEGKQIPVLERISRWGAVGEDVGKRTQPTWSQTIFLEGNFSRYGQMKFVFSHLYMIHHHFFSRFWCHLRIVLLFSYIPHLFSSPFDKIMECGSSVTHPLSSFLCFSWVILSMLIIYISPASLSLVFMAMKTMMARVFLERWRLCKDCMQWVVWG